MSGQEGTRTGTAVHLSVIVALGVGQILGWGSTYYLPAVLAKPIVADTGWPLAWIVTGLSLGSLTAGLIAPRVGRAIRIRGGRPVMILGTMLLAAGLIALGLAPSLLLHLLAWVVIGAGMGCSLYEAAFSTLGTLYGQDARRAITTLTLFGGFASTVCWTLSALFLDWFGWRGTCFAYAVLHLGVTLPLYRLGLPPTPKANATIKLPVRESQADKIAGAPEPDPQWLPFVLLTAGVSLSWAISSALSVHLLTILQAFGFDLAAAVGLGALVGPSQVGGRAIEIAIGKHYHPTWTLVTSPPIRNSCAWNSDVIGGLRL